MAREGLTTAFWSYAHADDDGTGGQIVRLRDQVDHAFQRHSGEPLTSFLDRQSLAWGEEWRSKINNTISGTTFFIAVLSPSYLKSPSCRDEFSAFHAGANDSELQELLLPILWVRVFPETDEEQRIWTLAQERQYVDWTAIRKLDEYDRSYVNLVDEMGERLAAVARRIKDKPEQVNTPPADAAPTPPEPIISHAPATEPSNDNPPGLVDLVVDLATQSEALTSRINEAMNTLTTMTQEVSPASFAQNIAPQQRILSFRKLANDIVPYTEKFEQLTREAEESARQLSRTIFTLRDAVDAEPQLREQLAAIDTETLRTSLEQLSTKLRATPDQRAMFATFGRMSRDLRTPFAAIERGFDSFDAIYTIISDFAAAFAKDDGTPKETAAP
ncbi:toll/interleukin-1 receptor domain-containing protein [Mycobacteroides abscessus]|uniref:toll/interleukin-1 receptor domain-containing protein n=1 Tax=Mycobacteroides abscessus TaxID=36809 RepID=UPI0005DA722E|nr:toll/interleukin-1 receptor domain-containing protein [Mycobacteroides abscessus]CPW62379.1 Uncharacterised protein [Mycobacteroides abscessus]